MNNTLKHSLLALAIGSSFLLTQTAMAKQIGTGTTSATQSVASAQQKAAVAVIESFGTGNTKIIKQYVNSNKYIQHNLTTPNGRPALIEAVKNIKGTSKVVRSFIDGDKVVVHSETQFEGEGKMVSFDVFRFENGLIVEHWDNIQAVPEKTVSGRSMTDGPTEVVDLDKTADNKKLVEAFMSEVLLKGNFKKLPDYISKKQYAQHNPSIGDGLTGLNAAIKYMGEHKMAMKYDQVHQYLGQGNFVLVMASGELSGKKVAFYDLFRVQAGKIVEHWDVIEKLQEKSTHKNTNGKF